MAQDSTSLRLRRARRGGLRLRLNPSCDFDTAKPRLRCLARKCNLVTGVRQINPTGKSLLIYGNRVKPQNKKYFAFPEVKIGL
jgi:hypothetical protein